MKMILSPCPFCGSEDVAMRQADTTVYAECTACYARGPANYLDVEAAKLWNETEGELPRRGRNRNESEFT